MKKTASATRRRIGVVASAADDTSRSTALSLPAATLPPSLACLACLLPLLHATHYALLSLPLPLPLASYAAAITASSQLKAKGESNDSQRRRRNQ